MTTKHPYQRIIDQCQIALNAVREQLGPERFEKASDDVSKYDEWLLGQEFAIDWLVEDQVKISQEAYYEFARAYRMMSREKNERLGHLSSLISESNS